MRVRESRRVRKSRGKSTTVIGSQVVSSRAKESQGESRSAKESER